MPFAPFEMRQDLSELSVLVPCMVFSKEQVRLSLLTTKKPMILFCKCKDKGGIWKIKFMFSKIQRFFVSAKQWFCNIKSAFYEIKLCMGGRSQCCILCTEKNGGLNSVLEPEASVFFRLFWRKSHQFSVIPFARDVDSVENISV